jgi:NADH-quinone oxidoreductase subunit L
MQSAELADTASALLRWIPLLPLLGSAACIGCSAAGWRSASRLIAPLAVLAAFAVSVAAVAAMHAGDAALIDRVYSWIAVAPLSIDAAFRLDRLSSVLVLIITGVGFLIHVYSVGYMHDDEDEARYFAYLNLFTAAMLILVLGDSLPVLFIGWEGVGLCSYLLIGFWYKDLANADAGQKAFIANRVGDAAFLIGMFLLFWTLADLGQPSLRFTDVNAMAAALQAQAPGVVTVVCLLLLIGATGKSAQIPLFVWLPDAMAGPTPVSALIHAATMVTAGVYMMCRLSPVYIHSEVALNVVASIGAATALFAATIAVVQRDLKKILAYSTVSQLGYMVMAVGVGAFSAAIFHLMTHAFFKALLFLCAGSVMHAMHGELDVYRMGGLRKQMPITAATFLVGALAIAGVPIFAGFFSKDLILESAFAGGHYVVWLIGLCAAALTAFYVFRAYFLAFEGASRVEPHRAVHLHESPATMTVPLVILAVLSLVGGWVGLPHGVLWGNHLDHYLQPSLAALHGGEHHLGGATVLLLTLVATTIALGSVAVAFSMYVKRPGSADRVQQRAGGLYELLWHKYYVDEIYAALILNPYMELSRLAWQVVDVRGVDGAINGIARLTGGIGEGLRRLQTGNVQSYALVMLVGAACLMWVLFR